MLPLYIPSTDTYIRDYSHKYTHPITGEVYGKTDYDNTSKLSEIGAISLIEVHQNTETNTERNGETLTIDNNIATLTYHYRQKTQEELDGIEAAKLPMLNLQNAYTEYLQLCQALGFNTKAGFQELFPALEILKQTNFNLSIELSVKLLAINSKIQYYGGTWDDCPNSL
jgi:hypothetical protein